VCGLRCDGASVAALLDAESERDEVGGGSHEEHVQGVRGVEPDRAGGALGARPEGVPVLIRVVLRENVQQIEDLVVEQLLEILTGDFHTLREVRTLLQVYQLLYLFHRLSHT
jgi:hypothetical protein